MSLLATALTSAALSTGAGSIDKIKVYDLYMHKGNRIVYVQFNFPTLAECVTLGIDIQEQSSLVLESRTNE